MFNDNDKQIADDKQKQVLNLSTDKRNINTKIQRWKRS